MTPGESPHRALVISELLSHVAGVPMPVNWYRCKLCGSILDMHYDHVSPSCSNLATNQECDGTFTHGRMDGACKFEGRTLHHDDVIAMRVTVTPDV